MSALLTQAATASAQSWALVEVTREANLDFGFAPQQYGTVQQIRTSPDVAKFKITASLPGAGTGERVVTLTFYSPNDLSGPASGLVPFEMTGAYNSEADDATTATVFHGSAIDIPLEISEGNSGGVGVFSAYVYVFGDAIVGAVPVGTYTADVILQAQALEHAGGTGTEGCDVGWDPSVWYNDGDWVEYQGVAWRSMWWNAGHVPGSSGATDPWEDMGLCDAPEEGPGCDAFAWDVTRVYDTADWTTYVGKAWRALFYTRGEVPGSAGSSGAWEEMGPCDGTPWDGVGCAALPWNESRVYDTGDQATHAGKVWEALFYTRGDVPGAAESWEEVESCGFAEASTSDAKVRVAAASLRWSGWPHSTQQ